MPENSPLRKGSLFRLRSSLTTIAPYSKNDAGYEQNYKCPKNYARPPCKLVSPPSNNNSAVGCSRPRDESVAAIRAEANAARNRLRETPSAPAASRKGVSGTGGGSRAATTTDRTECCFARLEAVHEIAGGGALQQRFSALLARAPRDVAPNGAPENSKGR